MIEARQQPACVRPLGGDFGDAEAQEIARLAGTQGWQSAAHDHMRSIDHGAYRLAVDEYSAGLRFLLPLTAESRVLVLKCGWGAVALNLAACTRCVVAMDDRPTRLRFAEARRVHHRAANLHTVCGSLTSSLPFGAETFDAAIMLEAFEQAQAAEKAGWKAAQRAALDEVGRVLLPGGWVLLGVANRLGFAYPQVAGQHLRTYWGYRQVLQKAGFTELRFYAPLPSQREPFVILPLDRWRPLNHFIDGLFTAQDYRSKLEARGLGSAYQLAWALWRVGRRLKLAGLGRYFVPSYLIMAQK